jgi:uncharacterized Zn-finger protein
MHKEELNEANIEYTYDRKVSCSDDHPIVYYVIGDDGRVMCEYCSKTFVYRGTGK